MIDDEPKTGQVIALAVTRTKVVDHPFRLDANSLPNMFKLRTCPNFHVLSVIFKPRL
jgi:hypothetical protein